MAAAAGTLQVRFEKPNTYIIGDGYREPEPTDVARVSVLIITASILTGAAGCLIIGAAGYMISII